MQVDGDECERHGAGKMMRSPTPVPDTRIGLQDDVTYSVRAGDFATQFPDLQKRLADAGHLLRGIKCSAWLPGCDHLETPDLPDEVQALFAHVPRATEGIDVLGSNAGGQFVDRVAEGDLRPGKHTQQRAQQAVDMLQRIHGASSGPARHHNLREELADGDEERAARAGL